MTNQGFSHKKKLIVIAGPTASGKTEVSINIARSLQTEIVSADSRQFYKEMTIGTAVPSSTELATIRHHFIQHISILQTYDVALYEQQALEKLDELFNLYDQVVLTGGSGLFLNAVCKGLDNIPDVSPEIRERLEKIYSREGLEALQKMLKTLDPVYFDQVDQQNPRRLQRALEVCIQTGNPYSSYRNQTPKSRNFDTIRIALQRDRMELVNRINLRVDQMMASGLLCEVQQLLPYKHTNALNTVGYKELFDFLEGAISKEQAIEQIKINTRKYAKRQMTWLRKNNDYHWFHPDQQQDILQFIISKL